ncbi:hypothetical protein F4775DRAFT_425825 [Biscogniauxia sp. FL1348]|nr:hypothetical protein F4775DRAFT_425825 [Biscogniauxia sp. FL1348]
MYVCRVLWAWVLLMGLVWVWSSLIGGGFFSLSFFSFIFLFSPLLLFYISLFFCFPGFLSLSFFSLPLRRYIRKEKEKKVEREKKPTNSLIHCLFFFKNRDGEDREYPARGEGMGEEGTEEVGRGGRCGCGYGCCL